MKQDNILVLDLGSSENTTIARWIRDLGVYSEIQESWEYLINRVGS